MKQKKSGMLRMVEDILIAPEDALACDQVLAQIPAAVDATIAGEDISKRFPKLVAHLKVCDQCRQQFEELLNITQMAEVGILTEPDQFPKFSFQQVRQLAERAASATERGQFLIRFRQYLEALRAGTFEPGIGALRHVLREGNLALALEVSPIRPAPVPMPMRSSGPLQTRRFAYHVEPIGLQITLKVREFERHRFTVRGLIEGDQAFEGLGISLLSSENNELLDCTGVDDANTFSFHAVSPGRYSVRLDVTAGEAICLTGVDI